MHPQFDELTAWVARFVGEPGFAFEVLEPEQGVSVEFCHVATLARPRRGLITQIRMVPSLMAPAPLDPTLRRRAEAMGFSISAPESRQPKYGVITDYFIEARFLDSAEGVDWCLAALQDIYQIADAWLWITDLGYDDWPMPLPKPSVWPPAG